MASDPITLWQVDGEKVGAVADVIFLGFKVTVDDGCGHYFKRHLLLENNTLTNLDNILNSRNITLSFPWWLSW